MTRGSVLLVDDEPKIRQALTAALRDEGHEVFATGSPREALRVVTERPFDLLVVDNLMPELGGLELIREVLAATGKGERPQILMMTAHATVESAIEAMKLGAIDYLQKPFEIDEFLVVVRRAVEHERLRTHHDYLITERDEQFDHYGIVGRSRAIQDVVGMAKIVAQSRSTVLIVGRDRHGQGAGRPRDSRLERAARLAARAGELRGAARHADRIRAVRPRAGRVHRRRREQEGPVRAGRRRIDPARRDRRDRADRAGQAPTRAAGTRIRAARLRADREGRRARSSRRPTATCGSSSPRASSRRISTTGST